MRSATPATEASLSQTWPTPPASQRTGPPRPTPGRAGTVAFNPEDPGGKYDGEVLMQGFIKNQMAVILQPFVAQVQQLDAMLCQLKGQLEKSDAAVLSLHGGLGEAGARASVLRASLAETDAGLVVVREGLKKCSDSGDRAHQELERTNGRVQRLQGQAEAAESRALEREQSVDEQLRELRAELKKVSEAVSHDYKGQLRALGTDLKDLRALTSGSHQELEKLKVECAQRGEQLHEARGIADRASAAVVKLQRSAEAAVARDAEMCRGLEKLHGQVAKLPPALQSVAEDTASLKQRQEHSDSLIKALQQVDVASHAWQEAQRIAHERLAGDVKVLEQGLAAVRSEVSDNCDGLSRANASLETARSGWAKASADIQKTSKRLEGLEGRHDLLCSGVDKTNGAVVELAQEQRRAASNVQGLQRELDKSNEALTCTKSQLDTTNKRVTGLGGEIGRTNEALQKLDSSVELCHAGFTGLQKGFLDTGTHMSSRPLTLPKLSATKDAKGLESGRPLTAKAADLVATWPRGEEESTTYGSPFSTQSLAQSLGGSSTVSPRNSRC